MSEERPGRSAELLLRKLRDLGVATDTSLDLPLSITYPQFEALGVAIAADYRRLIWLLSDWMNQGEELFKDKLYQAVEATGLNYHTLQNYARTARQVPSERRLAGVPFTVHTEVAPLEPEQQTLWLETAKKNAWKRDELRAKLRPVKQLPPHAGVGNGNVEDAAREVVRSAKKYGNDFLVQRPSFVQLCAALGEEV